MFLTFKDFYRYTGIFLNLHTELFFSKRFIKSKNFLGSFSLLNYVPLIQETFVTHKINPDSKPAYFILILPKYDFNSKLFISFKWEVVFFSNFAPPGTRAADVQYNSTGVRAPVYDRTKEQAHVDLVRVGQLHREPVTDKYASVQFLC